MQTPVMCVCIFTCNKYIYTLIYNYIYILHMLLDLHAHSIANQHILSLGITFPTCNTRFCWQWLPAIPDADGLYHASSGWNVFATGLGNRCTSAAWRTALWFAVVIVLVDIGCICDNETVICHGDAWLLWSFSTTQAACRPAIDGTPLFNHPTCRNHARTSLASKVSAAEHLTRLGIQQVVWLATVVSIISWSSYTWPK